MAPDGWEAAANALNTEAYGLTRQAPGDQEDSGFQPANALSLPISLS